MKSSIKIRGYLKLAKWVIYPTFALALINLLAFIGMNFYLGGDARNGYVQASHYFLCGRGHCTEASNAVWYYSLWHARGVGPGILLVFAEVAFFLNRGGIDFE